MSVTWNRPIIKQHQEQVQFIYFYFTVLKSVLITPQKKPDDRYYYEKIKQRAVVAVLHTDYEN